MPEISLNPVPAVSAARGQQNSAGNPPESLGAAQESGKEQPSFAQVLREQRPPEQKGASKAENGASADSRTDEAAPAEAGTAEAAAATAAQPAPQPVMLAATLALAAQANPPAAGLPPEGDTADAAATSPVATALLQAAATSTEDGTAASATVAEDTSAAPPASLAAPSHPGTPGTEGKAASLATAAPATAVPVEPRGAVQTQPVAAMDAHAEVATQQAQEHMPQLAGATQPDGAARTEQLNATYSLGQPAAPAEPPARHTIATPVMQRGWAEEVGQRLVWVANQDNGIAELVLTPPQLGRVEVTIHLAGDQASAQFVSASPLAREALQDALPRLRELLAGAGIQLGEANVSAGQSGQGHGTQGDPRNGGRSGGLAGNSMDMPQAGHAATGRQGIGLIDTFA